MNSASSPSESGARRWIVVTGAAMGIGRAVAESAVEAGYGVIGVDRAERQLAAVADALGDSFSPIVGDVTDRATHSAAAALAAERGLIAAWINNAGVDFTGSVRDIDLERIHDSLQVNLIAVAIGCSVAVSHWLDLGTAGAIVNVSSVQAVRGFPNTLPYQMAKGGVDALTRQVAVEYARYGIRCNAVQPGAVLTEMTLAGIPADQDEDATLARYASIHPLGRLAEPAEVAAAILFLAGDGASFITGVTLPVDGGATASR